MWRLGLIGLVGCAGKSPDTRDEDVTWHQDVAPIVTERCASCHHADGPAGFALDSFEAMQPWASLALVKIEGDDRPPYAMPPWFALDTPECAPPAPWVGDERLTDPEKALFRRWVEGGTPEGDPATAAPLPGPRQLDLPGAQSLSPPTPAQIAASQDDVYRCVSLDPGLAAPGWITGLQVEPDQPSVVHHVVVFTDPTGASGALGGAAGAYPCFGSAGVPDERVVLAWAPGSAPLIVPEDAGIPMPAGGRLVAQMHYHASGQPVTDATPLKVQWADSPPRYTARMEVFGVVFEDDANHPDLVDPPFSVPANVEGHTETIRTTLSGVGGADVRVWSLFSHMHLAGTDIRVNLEQPGGDTCLGHNPMWDFDWQRTYVFDAPFDGLPRVHDGDVLEIRCTYDNTVDNPVLMDALALEGLDAPVAFGAGEDTLDEMCVAIVGIVY